MLLLMNSYRRYEWSALSDPNVFSRFRICCTNCFAELATSSSDYKENYTSFVDSVVTAAEEYITPVVQTKKETPSHLSSSLLSWTMSSVDP